MHILYIGASWLALVFIGYAIVRIGSKNKSPEPTNQDKVMKVFKFYSDEFFYLYSGHNEEEAREALFEDVGVIEIDKTEEVPESEWDIKNISMWEDDDLSKEPYKVSIRDNMLGQTPILLCTNDLGDN